MKALLFYLATALFPLLAAPRISFSKSTLAPETRVEIIFDQAMVNPETVGKTSENNIVKITPDWPVKITWRSQNIATLVPQAPPQLSTDFQFSLEENLKAVDGTAVPAQKLKSITSENFQVTSSRRIGTARTGGTLLLFNDDINPVTAAAFFQFVRPNSETQTPLTIAARTRKVTWGDLRSRYYYQPSIRDRFTRKNLRYANPPRPKEEVIKHALIVEPVAPLPVGTNWKLRRLAYLPNAPGNASTTKVQEHAVGNVSPFTATISARTYPDQPRVIQISFNQSLPEKLTPQDFLSHLKFGWDVKDLEAVIGSSRRFVTLKGDFASRDEYKLTLSRALTSDEQLALKTDVFKKLKFSRLTPKINLPSSDESQLASGTRTYRIQSINNEKLYLRIKRLSSRDLVRASLGYRHYTGDGPDSKRFRNRIALPFELITGKLVADEEIVIDAPLDTTQFHTIKWDKYLPKNKKTGTFFLSITSEPAEHPDLRSSRSSVVQALVQVTDIGLAWKLTDDSAFLYAYSCATGDPLPEVELALFGEDAAPFEKITTGDDGTAVLPRAEKHRVLRARLGNDTLILPFDDSLPTVSMWRFPVNFSWNDEAENNRLSHLFTDRSLYRPGETVHLKGIVRELKKGTLDLPTAIKAKLTLTDPRRNVVLEKDLTLSNTGGFDQTVTLPKNTVGNYVFELTWPDELKAAEEKKNYWTARAIRRSASFTHRISVQEFQRNTFEVDFSLSDDLAYAVNARYFQGTPVANGKVSWFFNVRPTGFYPAKHRDYLFGDHRGYDPDYWNHYFGYKQNDGGSIRREGSQSENGKGELDETGKLAMTFELPELKFPTPRQVSVQTEITDPNSQTLSTTARTTVHSSDFYLGLLRQDRIARVGQEIPFKIVAVKNDGTAHSDPISATLTVEREVNKQIKSKAPNGKVVVKNEASLEPVLTRELTLVDGKVAIPVTPADPGKHFFTLTAKDESGRIVKTIVTRQIYGADQYPWAYDAGIRIKLVPEKQRYRPGENARLLVLSPIEGQALVTVEHEQVTRQFITPLTLEKPVIEIPITEDDAPNAFVSVLVIKGAADSKRKKPEPQLRLGYCDLTVDPAASRLAIELATGTSESRPGELITVSGKVSNHRDEPVSASEVTFYAVDEGTLAVMGYANPDPLSYFHQPRALRIKNGTSLGNFIPEDLEERYFGNKGFFVGGGDDDAFGGVEELEVRSDFSPTATWMPSILTRKDGTFIARFEAPDTLTRYRLIAVAHEGRERFGTGIGEALVNKPLMLEPSPPAFAHQGDRIRPKALIQNTTDTAGTWKVSLKLDSTTSANTTLMTEVEVPAKGQTSLDFEVIFANTGTAKWIWTAEPIALQGRELNPALKRHYSDSVESTFEVRYPMPLLREVGFNTLTKSGGKTNLLEGFSPNLLAGKGHVEVSFARSRLLEAGGAMDYLLRYPYGCAEQTTSSTVPWIAAKTLRHLAPGFQKKTPAEIDKAIQAGADRILGMQTSDGGLAYWPGGRSSSDWASSYAGLGLVLCKEAGASVPQSALDRLAVYLSKKLRNLSSLKTDYQFEIYARSLYVLARLGKAEQAYQSKFFEMLSKSQRMPRGAKAFLALAMQLSNQQLSERVMDFEAQDQEATGYWMPYRNEEAFELLAWSTVRPNSPKCEAALTRLLANRSPRGHWRTTWNNAWSLLAMSAYAKTHETSMDDIHLAIETNDGLVNATIPKGKPSHTIKLPIDGEFKLLVSSDAPTYVQRTLAAKPKIAPMKSVSRKGLTVMRKYERIAADGSAAPLTAPKVGDLVKVTLSVGMPDRQLRYLAIDDPLPSSFKAINTDFASQAGRVRRDRNWRISHQEVRMDRVLFFVDYPQRSRNLTLTYHARITHPGELYVPQTKVEEMYDPTSFALGATQTLTVR